MSNQPKRPRLDNDVSPSREGSNVQPVVVGESPEGAAPIVDVGFPKLKTIPKLLFVDLHKDDADVVAKALVELHEMCWTDNLDDTGFQNNKTRKKVVGMGAPMMMLAVIGKWREEVEILGSALTCLAVFLYNEWEQKVAIDSAGGLDLVVFAMKKFPDNIDIQDGGVLVLRSLVDDEYPDSLPKPAKMSMKNISKRLVEDKDGVALVIKAMTMKEFPAENAACGILEQLSRTKLFHETLLKAGAIPVVANLVNHHMMAKASNEEQQIEELKESASGFMVRMLAPSRN